MTNIVKKCFWGLALIVSVSVTLAYSVYAVDTVEYDFGCEDSSTPFYAGFKDPPVDAYDVYIKLGRVGQVADVRGFYQLESDGSSTCEALGSVEASGDEWRKLGIYTHPNNSGETMFQLSSSVLSDTPTANRPILLLLSQNNPACTPRLECEIEIAGQPAYLRPSINSTDQNSLRVINIVSLDGDPISRVKYYVDNELMYTTKKLEDFDVRSIPYYGNKLIRIVEYASGQSAVIENELPVGHTDNISSMLVRTFRRYQDVVLVAVLMVTIFVLIRMIRTLIVHIEHHHQWLVDHGVIDHRPEPELTPQLKQRLYVRQIFHTVYTTSEVVILVFIFVATTVLVLSTYVISIGTVNGQSMVSSYEDEQQIVIDKLPITFAHINNSTYVPKRGEVVVAYPNFGGGTLDEYGDVEERTIIKRVIGLPGDRVVVDENKITIYNDKHKDGFDPSNGAKWAANIQDDDTIVHIDIVLSENEVFICGDNRPESIDSRYNGPISTNQIVGVVHDF